MSILDEWMSKFRQPEYIGENRCLPCTAVNLVISVGVAAAVGLIGVFTASDIIGVGLAICVLFTSMAAIYLRGYLIPATPELTNRYLPVRLLQWFGKGPRESGSIADEPVLNPEEELVAIGVLEECERSTDLCLVPEFHQEWNAEIERIDQDDISHDRLLDVLDIDEEGEISINEFDDAFRVLIEGHTVGTWESRAAYLADLTGARVLAERHPRWNEISVRNRAQLLAGLRLFIERCPDCSGTVEFGLKTVESCCSSREVTAVECDNCGARLFESRPVR